MVMRCKSWLWDTLGRAAKKNVVRYQLLTKQCVIEGSLEVKLPTIWTDEKQTRAEA
jgi:hypothetical protein